VWARRLPETLEAHNRRPLSGKAIASAICEVLTHRRTVLLTLAMAFLYAVMTVYLANTEVILGQVFGYGVWFPLYFGVVAVLLAANSLNNARMVRLFGAVRLVRVGSIVGIASAAAMAALAFTNGGHPNFWLFTIALCAVIPMAQGLSPTSNALAMSPVPHVAGTASSVITTVTTAGGAVLGGLAASAFDGTVRPFSVYILGFMVAAGALILAATSRTSTEVESVAGG
jgi:DHA1 family bicyclomycin/chloramphenicol resistance-like MFS transporter